MKVLYFVCLFSIFVCNVTLQKSYATEDVNGVDVNDFPEDVNFFTPEARQSLPEKMAKFYGWPSEEEISSQLVKEGERVLKAREQSIKWIKKVLKPKFIPRDIENRLLALNREKDCDQTRIRYRVKNHAIQIRQINNSVTILVKEIGKEPVDETSAKLKLVGDTVERLLNQENKIKRISCSGAYAIWHGLLKGGPTSSDIKNSSIYWWGQVHWLTDGHTVYFSIPKEEGGPVKPSKRKDWF